MHLPLWMEVVLFLCRNKGESSSFCAVTQKYTFLLILGVLTKSMW